MGRTAAFFDEGSGVALAAEGSNVAGPIRTIEGDSVGRTAIYGVEGGVAVPLTTLGVDPATVGEPGGPAGPLDQNGEIPLSQMPIDGLNYQGAWDASTNTPTLADGVGTAGDLYRVSVAGSQDLGSGVLVFEVGDHVIYEGAVWQQLDPAQVIDWGDIQGTLANQTDLQAALDAKAATSSLAAVATSGNYDDLSNPAVDRISGVVELQLDGEDLIWPSDIDNGKIRLWNGNPGSANRFYGLGIDQITFLIQGDENVNFSFNKSDGTDARIELFRIANNGDLTAQGDLHMSEKKVINIADGTNARDAVNRQQLDAATTHQTIATHSDGADITLTPTDPTVQIVDASSAVAAVVVTLPAAGTTAGKIFTIKMTNPGGNGIDINTAGGNIDGTNQIGMAAANAYRTLVSDGTDWWVIASSGT